MIRITKSDLRYPKLLKEIHKPPKELFVRGDLGVLSKPTLAVVGSRKMSFYGRNVLSELIPELVNAGITIVSGLAIGIDGEAHRQTLASGGKTVAVLGSGIDDKTIYPGSHQKLAAKILTQGGAILSEYPAGTRAFPAHFPKRNRILSGLCLGSLVVEAAERSGSLITARTALDQNRDVFAVPGDITRDTATGVLRLIQRGAYPIMCAADILDILNIPIQQKTLKAVGKNKTEIQLLELLGRSPVHIDVLVRESGIPAHTVLETLMMLELRGAIQHMGTNHYRL